MPTRPDTAAAITVGDKGRVTLSEELRQKLNIQEGDVLIPEITDHGTLELVPVALVPRDQVWFTHPEVQQRMAEAHADIAAGRTTQVTSRDEMKTALRKLRKSNRQD